MHTEQHWLIRQAHDQKIGYPNNLKEEFEDTKGVIMISICISKKNRQHNGQKKKYKRANPQNKHTGWPKKNRTHKNVN